MNQIELHKKIDELIQVGPTGASVDVVKKLIQVNPDVCQYFYTKADERWLGWLWDNGLLDVIKEKSKDPKQISYRTPELNYFVKVAGKDSEKVVDIMLAVPISAESFNPEVIDQFLRICSTLPAEQLARIVSKIRDKEWIPLMGAFNQWGFEYEKMFQILEDAKDYKSILILAETVLVVRSKEEVSKDGYAGISTDKPFYFNDLSYTKVFEHLASVDDEHAEAALGLVAKVMSMVVLLGGKGRSDSVFPIEEMFHLFDVDFFELQLGEKEHLSYRDDVRQLAAVIKILLQRLVGDRCVNTDVVRKIYNQYIKSLPKSRAMWRLRLFALSLCPKAFRDELKQSFLQIFETDRYHEFISGTEYHKTLQAGFSVLSENDKREYVTRVIEYFIKKDQEKENEKENWHIRYGSEILSMIVGQLTEKEKQIAKDAGFIPNPNYEPEPSIGRSFAGTVVPQAPPDTEEEWGNPVREIVELLKTKWAPEALQKAYAEEGYSLRPINAEGVAGKLQNSIKERLEEYARDAFLFFDRQELDAHYTYSFLRGIHEAIKNDRERAVKIKWDSIIALCEAIKLSGERDRFEGGKREAGSFDVWLAGWTAVHSAIADVIQELISEERGNIIIDFLKYRDKLFMVIGYLFAYPDPVSKNKMEGQSDPFTAAINTERGRAFQAFTLFVYQDGKKFDKDAVVKISDDVKRLYEDALKRENTQALMFMFGHYLPSFYFRDRKWIRWLLPQIFPADHDKKDLYLAAWEGYLANNLYQEMFLDSDIQKLYKRGIALVPEEYTKRKYFRELDEGLAIHLALAFMHYEEFGFDHPLFVAFWKSNPERHAKFISFIGRSFISGDNMRTSALLKESPRSKEKLQEFWDWALEHCKDSKSLSEFGFWVNIEKGIFDTSWLAKHIKKTLEKTHGIIDWEYGFMRSVSALAKSAPSETLEIFRLFLLEAGVRSKQLRVPFLTENEVFEAFQALYNNPDTKSDTYVLIDDLIREGGSIFWKLKDVLNNTQ